MELCVTMSWHLAAVCGAVWTRWEAGPVRGTAVAPVGTMSAVDSAEAVGWSGGRVGMVVGGSRNNRTGEGEGEQAGNARKIPA